MPFGGFVDEYTNSPVQPAFSTYLRLNLTGNVALDWSQFTTNTTNPLSQLIQVLTNSSATNTITLPDATFSSVQQTFFIANSSGTNFFLNDFDNNLLATITPGQLWFFALTDNTTTAGTWFRSTVGGTISPGDASALVGAGYGLFAEGGLIKLNYQSVPVTVPGYNVTNNDRGRMLVWVAGTGALNLPDSSLFSTPPNNGFVFSLANQSQIGGKCAITPFGTDKINGANEPFELNQGESTFLVLETGNNNWVPLAFTQISNQSFKAQEVPINDTAITISSTEARPQLQIFVNGSEAGDATVYYPNGFIQNYIFWNNTTSQNITVTQPTPSINSYVLTPGMTVTLFSNGNNLFPDDNVFYGLAGTAAKPIFTFRANAGDGMWQSGAGSINFSNAGVEKARLSNGVFELTTTNTTTPVFAPFGMPTTGYSFPTTTSTAFSIGGTNVYNVTSSVFGINVPIREGDGTVGAPSYSFSTSTNSGMFLNSGSVTFSVNGTNSLFLGETQNISDVPFTVSSSTNNTTPEFSFNTFLNYGINYNQTADRLNFITNGTTEMWIDAAGQEVNITSLNVGNLAALDLTLTNPLTVPNGGTGLDSAVTGDLLYGSAANTLSRLAIGSPPGKSLVVNPAGTLPTWGGLSILNIVSTTVTASSTFSNTTLASIGLNAPSITPKSSNSRFMITINSYFTTDVAAFNPIILGLMRKVGAGADTLLVDAGASGFTTSVGPINSFSVGQTPMQCVSFSYLDSPATTSALVYSWFAAQSSGVTSYFNRNDSGNLAASSTITVVEIGGL